MSKRKLSSRRKHAGDHPSGSSGGGVVSEGALLDRGKLLYQQGNIPEAYRVFEQIIHRYPQLPMGYVGAGQCAALLGRVETGISHLRRAVALNGHDEQTLYIFAELLMRGLHGEESLEVSERLLAMNPNHVMGVVLAAKNLELMQRFDEAFEHVEKALAGQDDDVNLLLTKGHLYSRRKEYDEALDLLRPLRARGGLQPGERAQVEHEIGMILDRLGEYDEAFVAFTKCGSLMAETHGKQAANDQAKYKQIAAYRRGFTASVLTRFTPEPFSSMHDAPALLVGFPRSGTTMTEQILASHPEIETSGERPFFGYVGMELSRMIRGSGDVGKTMGRLQIAGAKKLRKVYWSAVKEQMGEAAYSSKYFVDKMPLNIIGLGLVNAVFPEARVLVALRDPRDVCLSCFFQQFSLNNSMVQFLTLEGTARFYEAVMDLYLYYRDILSLNMIEIRYEDTVRDLEGEAHRLLDHIGAPWSDGVLSFHEKAREQFIGTPSYSAVTEKVYTRSVNRWKNYEKHIEPVLPHLERFIKEFGYDQD